MYVRLVTFTLQPGKNAVASAVAEDIVPAISGQPGCRSVTCFGDADSGRHYIYVLWNSQEEADAAAAIISPKLEQHLAGNVQAPPERGLFRVLGSA